MMIALLEEFLEELGWHYFVNGHDTNSSTWPLNNLPHKSISVPAVQNMFMMSVSFRMWNLVGFDLDLFVSSSTIVNIELFYIYKQQELVQCHRIIVCTYLKK